MWEYFDLKDDRKVLCKQCNVKLAYNNSTVAICNRIHHRHVGVSLGEASRGGKQMAIRPFTYGHRRCDPLRSDKITELISEMMARDLLDFPLQTSWSIKK